MPLKVDGKLLVDAVEDSQVWSNLVIADACNLNMVTPM